MAGISFILSLTQSKCFQTPQLDTTCVPSPESWVQWRGKPRLGLGICRQIPCPCRPTGLILRGTLRKLETKTAARKKPRLPSIFGFSFCFGFLFTDYWQTQVGETFITVKGRPDQLLLSHLLPLSFLDDSFQFCAYLSVSFDSPFHSFHSSISRVSILLSEVLKYLHHGSSWQSGN